jgi:hypothetical protein
MERPRSEIGEVAQQRNKRNRQESRWNIIKTFFSCQRRSKADLRSGSQIGIVSQGCYQELRGQVVTRSIGFGLQNRPSRPTQRSTERSRQKIGHDRPGVMTWEEGGVRKGKADSICKGLRGGEMPGCWISAFS